MERLTEKVHQILLPRLHPGDVAIDATAGNGHDTVFLAEAVGPAGTVYAFDVQEAAIERTRARLEKVGLENVKLFAQNHAELAKSIPEEHHGQVKAITFNLGYLPGSDKSATTKSATTRRAIEFGLPLLQVGGVMTILAYTGHPGGLEETLAVGKLLETLCKQTYHVDMDAPAKESAPRLFVVRRANLG